MNSHQKTISAMQMNFKNLDNKATARRNVLTYGNSCIFKHNTQEAALAQIRLLTSHSSGSSKLRLSSRETFSKLFSLPLNPPSPLASVHITCSHTEANFNC